MVGDVEQLRYRLRALITEAQATITAVMERLAQLDPIADQAQVAMRASADDRAALHAAVAALEQHQPAFGWVATAALSVASSKDYVITLNRPVPAGATVRLLPDPALAGKATATVKAQTDTTVTITVTALVAAASGGVTVIAYA